MGRDTKNVVILGSTGSIGRNCLEVIRSSGGRLRAYGLSAHRRLEEAIAQAAEYAPRWLIGTDPEQAHVSDCSQLPASTELLWGMEEVERAVADPEVDVVVAAMVGSAGLPATLAAATAGKRIALANKEALVVAGPLVVKQARQSGGTLIPVDSEHSAIFQALHAGQAGQVERIVLTASGGPFWEWSLDEMHQATVQQALAHPTWRMGPKISIDSATMMNKALEIIEARWMFDLPPEKIQVVVHPQSIIHSLVEFVDGSVVAQMSPPDMRLPIQYALSYPERWNGCASRVDWSRPMRMDFQPPDEDRFPALRLGHEVARKAGTAGAVLNAANEAAVEGFLAGQIRLTDIVPACQAVLEQHQFDPDPTLQQLLQLDRWARQEVRRWICRRS